MAIARNGWQELARCLWCRLPPAGTSAKLSRRDQIALQTMLTAVIQIRVAKWLDEYAGRVLVRLLYALRPRLRPRRNGRPVARVLMIKFWGMGSIILAEPALRVLRANLPGARVDFLTLEQNVELFGLMPHVHRVHALAFGPALRMLWSAARLVVKLRREQYDLVLDAEFFANFSALLGTLIGPAALAGFTRPGAAKACLLDLQVPFDNQRHAVENFVQLVQRAAPASAGEAAAAVATAAVMPPRLSWLVEKRQQKVTPCVVININASPLALERRWPAEYFVVLVRWLLQHYCTRVLLIGSAAERVYTQRLAAALGETGQVVDLAGRLTLRDLAAVLCHAALLISNDSGPLHLAAALRTPVVGFYGPETPARFGPVCERRLVFHLGLPCSPCMSVENAKTVNCTHHQRCLRDLTVARVVALLARFIAQHELLPLRQPGLVPGCWEEVGVQAAVG